jgi:hypothetical protein
LVLSFGNAFALYSIIGQSICQKGGAMKTLLLKLTLWAVLVVALLSVGFAAGFPIGQSIGFATGSEWSLVQADIVAREAGVFMPVTYKEGAFRVVIKQPQHLYKKAWQLADRHEEEMVQVNKGKTLLIDRIQLAQRISIVQ